MPDVLICIPINNNVPFSPLIILCCRSAVMFYRIVQNVELMVFCRLYLKSVVLYYQENWELLQSTMAKSCF